MKGICPDFIAERKVGKPVVDIMPQHDIDNMVERCASPVSSSSVEVTKGRHRRPVSSQVLQPLKLTPEIPKVDKKIGELIGHVMSDDENVAFFSSKLGCYVFGSEISVSQRMVRLDGDQRVLANRDYKMAHNDYSEVTLVFNPLPYRAILRSIKFVAFIVMGFVGLYYACTHASVLSACMFDLLSNWVICVVSYFLMVVYQFQLCYVWITQDPNKRKVVKYLPHVITQLLLDFSRGCNQETVAASIRPKINRMANFPIHQANADVVVLGSEMVAEFLISRQDFSIMEATSL